ncbi:MAG: hypothetical protein CMO81_08440 [Waddliaceae bacterium]|nr:hypothetical protein [Waddliaceae bacterium]
MEKGFVSYQVAGERGTYTFPYNVHTGLLYWDDSPNTVRLKHLGIFALGPLHIFTSSLTYFSKGVLSGLSLPELILHQPLSAKRAVEETKRHFQDSFRSVFYGGKMMLANAQAWFQPYKGRERFALFQRQLHRDGNRPDFHRHDYFARCCQPLVDLYDPEFEAEERMRIYVLRREDNQAS